MSAAAQAATGASQHAAPLRLVHGGSVDERTLRPVIGTRQKAVLGDPTPLVCTVAKTATEVVLGQPGVDTLIRWVTPTVRSSLQAQHSLARRASYNLRGQIAIVRVRLCRVSAHAVEAAVVATEGDRSRAVAMRLEASAGRWLVTALDVG